MNCSALFFFRKQSPLPPSCRSGDHRSPLNLKQAWKSIRFQNIFSFKYECKTAACGGLRTFRPPPLGEQISKNPFVPGLRGPPLRGLVFLLLVRESGPGSLIFLLVLVAPGAHRAHGA